MSTSRYPLREGAISVSPDFHALVLVHCDGWLTHLVDVELGQVRSEDPRAHLRPLPRWARELVPRALFDYGRVPREAAVEVAARLLGVAPRTIYRGQSGAR